MISALILAAAGGPVKPVRSLTYAFTQTTSAARVSGTIAADVLGITKDGGLVVRFKQAGKTAPSFPAQICTVYADTRVACANMKHLSPVEMELGHLLGRNFVDGNNLDAQNHWRLAGPTENGTETDDFTITSNHNGILSITESRTITGPHATHHAASITYDMNHTVPVHVKYTDQAPGSADGAVEVRLLSDSLQSAKPAKP